MSKQQVIRRLSVAAAVLMGFSNSKVEADETLETSQILLTRANIGALSESEKSQIIPGDISTELSWINPESGNQEWITDFVLVYRPTGKCEIVPGTHLTHSPNGTPSGDKSPQTIADVVSKTTGVSKKAVVQALPATGQVSSNALYIAGFGMVALAGFLAYRNKASRKVMFVAVVAASVGVSTAAMAASNDFLDLVDRITVQMNQRYTHVAPETECWEYVGYIPHVKTKTPVPAPGKTTIPGKSTLTPPAVTANPDGSVTVTPPPGATEVVITYIPEGKDTPETVVITKDPETGTWVPNTPGIVVDPTTGVVTLPNDKVKDNEPVTAIAKDPSGKSSTPGQDTPPASINPPTVIANPDGSVTVTPPPGATEVVITYIPEGKDTPETVVITKDPETGTWVPNTPGIVVDPTTGVVTLPNDKVKDNEPVTAIAKDPSGKSSTPGQDTPPASINPPTVTANPDGSVTVTPPPGATEVVITYIPEGKDTPETVVITKDPETGTWVPNTPGIVVDPTTGVVTLPNDKVKDNEPVTAIAKDPSGKSSTPGQDTPPASINPPTVTANPDGSVTVTPPPGATEVVITYIPEGKDTPETVVITKDPETGTWVPNTPGIVVDPTTGVVTLPNDKVKDNEPVTAIAKDPSGKSSTPGQDTPPASINPPTVTANPDGSVTVTPPPGATEVVITYIPEGKDTPETVVITKDPETGTWVPNTPGIVVDPTTGVVTLPNDKVKDNEPVTAIAKDPSGKSSTPGQDTPPASINPPTVTANPDGSVTVTPPPGATEVVITYIPEGKDTPETVVITKDPETGTWVPNTPGIVVDPTTGVVTLPNDKVKDNEPVTAIAKDPSGKSSTPGTETPAGKRGSVTVHFKDENGTDLQPPRPVITDAPVGTTYDVSNEVPETIEKDGVRYILVPEATTGNPTGQVAEGDTPVVFSYKKVGNWVPTFPSVPGQPTPVLPPLPYTPGKPVIPYVPGYEPATPLQPVDPTDPTKGYIPPKPTNPGEDTPVPFVPVNPEIARGNVTVYFKDENGTDIQPPRPVITDAPVGTTYDVSNEAPETIEKDGVRYVRVPNGTTGNPTGQVAEGDNSVVFSYKKVGNWVPTFPSVPGQPTPVLPTLPYPVDPANPTVPVIPHIPGFVPAIPLEPVDPADPTKGYYPPVPTNPGENTPVPFVPVTPGEQPKTPEQPQPEQPEQPKTPEQPQPEQPEQPKTPEQPQPEQPEQPKTPEQPQPEQPEQPKTPEQPQPEQPEQPKTPEQPQPEQPEQPKTPEQPQPEQPEQPKTPEQPQPEQPEQPKTPEQPQPEQPEQPKTPEQPQPEQPEQPKTPEQPQPEQPEQPKTPEQPQPEQPEQPKTPEQPQPEQPEQPKTPEQPQPEQPEQPKTPEQPQPEQPEQPKTPEQPQPEQPEQPKTPEQPQPEQPEQPKTPEQPQPEQPEQPKTPEQPQPEQPEQPKTPEQPQPEQPEQPKTPEQPQPEQPEQPKTPEQPQPEQPEQPKTPEQPQPEQPEQPQPKRGRVIVRYEDTEGNVIKEELVLKDNVEEGTDYDSRMEKEFTITKNGVKYVYDDLKEGSATERGKVVEGDTVITYVYEVKAPKTRTEVDTELLTGTVVTRYIDIDTGEEIVPGSTIIQDALIGTRTTVKTVRESDNAVIKTEVKDSSTGKTWSTKEDKAEKDRQIAAIIPYDSVKIYPEGHENFPTVTPDDQVGRSFGYKDYDRVLQETYSSPGFFAHVAESFTNETNRQKFLAASREDKIKVIEYFLNLHSAVRDGLSYDTRVSDHIEFTRNDDESRRWGGSDAPLGITYDPSEDYFAFGASNIDELREGMMLHHPDYYGVLRFEKLSAGYNLATPSYTYVETDGPEEGVLENGVLTRTYKYRALGSIAFSAYVENFGPITPMAPTIT